MYQETTINLLKEWRLYLIRLQIAHYKTSQKYIFQSFWIKFPIVILSALSTALSISAISNNNNQTVIINLIGALTIAVTFLNIIEPKLGFASLASRHKVQSSNYRKIIMMIEKQLVVQATHEEILVNDIIKASQGLEDTDLIIPEKFYCQRNDNRDKIINCNVTYRRSTLIDTGENFDITSHHSLPV